MTPRASGFSAAGGTEGHVLNEQCTTTFTVMDGTVKGLRWEGTACGA
jgi:hypothetical protein